MIRVAIGFVLAALLGSAFFVAFAAAVDPGSDPIHTNGHVVEDFPKATYQLLGVAPLPEGRLLQLVLVTEEDIALLLVILVGPDGQRVALLPW